MYTEAHLALAHTIQQLTAECLHGIDAVERIEHALRTDHSPQATLAGGHLRDVLAGYDRICSGIDNAVHALRAAGEASRA